MIEVIDPGARTTIQDLGRPGYAHRGVPCSGAADRPALTLANRLVGNPEGAPALETTLRGPTLRFEAAATIALTGAPVDALVDGRPAAMNSPVHLRAGAVLTVGSAIRGLRTYVAVRGGIDVGDAASFGSASSDQLTGLGPAPLAQGDRVTVPAASPELVLAHPGVDLAPVAQLAGEPLVRIEFGPRADWFEPEAAAALVTAPFQAQPQVDRIGARLAGPTLNWAGRRELRSEGMVTGALQVPPSGDPIVLLADHPTTGGYPVIAVVIDDDLPVVAQLTPGMSVRFRPV